MSRLTSHGNEHGFVLMMLLLILIVVAGAAFVYMRLGKVPDF